MGIGVGMGVGESFNLYFGELINVFIGIFYLGGFVVVVVIDDYGFFNEGFLVFFSIGDWLLC